ncbi:hypothetical protein VMCG_03036 [Cytospora schulzeri]|uniref:Mid2 domain-containing protein n=1 Tax=Cytospora schulzeri TaxID=448051 RepID=A0A423WXV0_9PEZI|nr:hypothetical protein VMCG_03036 [Valsa malicola]
MGTIIGGDQGQTTEAAYSTSSLDDYTFISSNADAQPVTVTVTQGENTSTTPTATSEAGLVTAAPGTASSSITLVYVYTASSTASSLPESSSSTPSGHVSSLSPGVIAGIVIGSLVFLIALVLITFCTSRRFARKKRRETSLHTGTASLAPSYHQSRSTRSRHPPQELATQYNQLEMGGRGRPFEMTGSHLHPVELQAGSMTDLTAHVWKGIPPGVGYLSPGGRAGGEAASDGGGSGEYLNPGSWETVSSNGAFGNTQAGLSSTTLHASSSDHSQ